MPPKNEKMPFLKFFGVLNFSTFYFSPNLMLLWKGKLLEIKGSRQIFKKKKKKLRGKFQNLGFLGFLGFLRKNLKVKKAYLGDFSAKNEKNIYGFGKQMKSLLSKGVLRFGQNCIYK